MKKRIVKADNPQYNKPVLFNFKQFGYPHQAGVYEQIDSGFFSFGRYHIMIPTKIVLARSKAVGRAGRTER